MCVCVWHLATHTHAMHTTTHAHIHTTTHTRAHTHTIAHARTHTHHHTHARAHTHYCTHARMHTHTITHAHTHHHAHACMHTHTITHAHTRIHTIARAHTCTHTCTLHAHTFTQLAIGSKVVGHEVRQLGGLMSSGCNVATREQRDTPLCYLSTMALARLSSQRQHRKTRPVLRALPFINSCLRRGAEIAFASVVLALKRDAAEDS